MADHLPQSLSPPSGSTTLTPGGVWCGNRPLSGDYDPKPAGGGETRRGSPYRSRDSPALLLSARSLQLAACRAGPAYRCSRGGYRNDRAESAASGRTLPGLQRLYSICAQWARYDREACGRTSYGHRQHKPGMVARYVPESGPAQKAEHGLPGGLARVSPHLPLGPGEASPASRYTPCQLLNWEDLQLKPSGHRHSSAGPRPVTASPLIPATGCAASRGTAPARLAQRNRTRRLRGRPQMAVSAVRRFGTPALIGWFQLRRSDQHRC